MKNRRIYCSLDKDWLRSAADKSRARHLFDLMNKQEEEENRYYRESTASYNKSQIYKFAPDVEEYIVEFVDSTNTDIKSAIKEYKLYDVGIWEYISQYLQDLKGSWSRGDGLKYATLYDANSDGAKARLGDTIVFIIGTYEGTNNGDPDDFFFDVEQIDENEILSYIYDIYKKHHKYNDNEFLLFVDEVLGQLLGPISSKINMAIEDCLMDNPPPLE